MTDPLATPGAPRPGTGLCTLAELDQYGTRGFTFREGHALFQMFLVRTAGGGVRAYVNSCPHMRTPLNFLEHRFLSGDRTRLQCATHGAQFQPEDGLCIAGPCVGARLTPIPIALDGETILIAGPDGSP